MTTSDVRQQLAADIELVAAATDRLIASISELSDGDIAGPSLLPGWSLGHCLTHIARNADGIGNLVTWAMTGERTPMYPSMAARDADIDTGSIRPAVEHRDDIASSAARLDESLRRLSAASDEALERLVIFGAPPPTTPPNTPAADLGFARLREVSIHHADLGLADFGYTNFDAPFVTRTLAFIEARSGAVEVSGPPVDVLTWRLGRGTPQSLTDEHGNPPGPPPAW